MTCRAVCHQRSGCVADDVSTMQRLGDGCIPLRHRVSRWGGGIRQACSHVPGWCALACEFSGVAVVRSCLGLSSRVAGALSRAALAPASSRLGRCRTRARVAAALSVPRCRAFACLLSRASLPPRASPPYSPAVTALLTPLFPSPGHQSPSTPATPCKTSGSRRRVRRSTRAPTKPPPNPPTSSPRHCRLL